MPGEARTRRLEAIRIRESHGSYGRLIREASEDIAWMLAVVDDLAEALRAVQYEKVPMEKGGGVLCRCCGRWLDEGCNDACRVSLALARLAEEAPQP